jgi:hypothetical protein
VDWRVSALWTCGAPVLSVVALVVMRPLSPAAHFGGSRLPMCNIVI